MDPEKGKGSGERYRIRREVLDRERGKGSVEWFRIRREVKG